LGGEKQKSEKDNTEKANTKKTGSQEMRLPFWMYQEKQQKA